MRTKKGRKHDFYHLLTGALCATGVGSTAWAAGAPTKTRKTTTPLVVIANEPVPAVQITPQQTSVGTLSTALPSTPTLTTPWFIAPHPPTGGTAAPGTSSTGAGAGSGSTVNVGGGTSGVGTTNLSGGSLGVTGTGSTVSGGGTLVINGPEYYNPTSGGTLVINGAGSNPIGAGTGFNSGGGTLQVGGAGTGEVNTTGGTLNMNGWLETPGSGLGYTVTGSGTLTITGENNYEGGIELTGGGEAMTLTNAEILELYTHGSGMSGATGGGDPLLFPAGDLNIQSGSSGSQTTVGEAVVPEPASLAVCFAGAFALIARRRPCATAAGTKTRSS